MNFSNKRIENARRVIGLLALVVTSFYLYWRYTETFNPNALVFSWALFGAELFGAITTLLFYFTVWKPTTRIAPPPIQGRSVDVLIPTKNESVAVLRKTLLACNDLRYPHRTLVLDDGNRAEVKALCDELSCVYLARASYEHAKAGNLNFGLQHSDAEFIAIFDADHIPLPHFIDRLIGYFEDSKVGFVQVPQEFYNIDSIQHRTDRKQKTIWGEQYLFFSLIQPGRDHWNAAYFVGSCAILRRKTLDDIGGFATGSITEDMLTSIKIHAKKWLSVYHNENLAFGIAAETLKPFSIQRQRWGIGNWQVFFKANPLFIKGLTLPQRLSYLSSMIYPLEGLQKLIFYATPPVALFTGVLPMRALDVNYLIHFIPYFFISIYGFNEMARGVGGQIMLEQYSMAKFFTYLKTMLLLFIPKKGKEFKVTPKGEEGRGGGVSFGLILPQFIVLIASFMAILWALVETLLDRRHDSFIVAVNSFWALYNSGLALAIINFDYRKLFQRRTAFRIPDTLVTYYRPLGEIEGGDVNIAVAENITEEGMSIIAVNEVPVGKELDIELMLPKSPLRLQCRAVRAKSVSIEQYQVSQIGLLFTGISQEERDTLSRYLHESAVTKFMRDYVLGYRTYVERRFGKKSFLDRATRSFAYLPVLVRGESDSQVYAAIKDISNTGLLLTTRDVFPQGSRLTISVVLGKDRISLTGDVVRTFAHPNESFPEYLLGVQFTEESSKKVKSLLMIANKIGDFILE
jgi:cellulose synthase (UDP-forming)